MYKPGDLVSYKNKKARVIGSSPNGEGCFNLYVMDTSGAFSTSANVADIAHLDSSKALDALIDDVYNKKESKKSEESVTGSLRFNTGKPQTSEIDPSFILGLAKVLEASRAKYPRGNWMKGNHYSVPWDSAVRHLQAWQLGEKIDNESKQGHLYHAAINIMMLAFYEDNFPEFDDRLFKKEK